MRSRMLLGLLLVGAIVAGVVVVGPAGAARRAGAAITKSVSVSFPIPPANTAAVEVVTIKAKASKDKKVGSIRVRTTHDPHLQNESIVYMIQAPAKHAANATFKVYALIMYTSGQPGSASTAQEPTLGVHIYVDWESPFGNSIRAEHDLNEDDCADLKSDDGLFEGGHDYVDRGSGKDREVISLQSALPESEQGSPPEEVLDNLVASAWQKQGCPGQPEGDDPGTK